MTHRKPINILLLPLFVLLWSDGMAQGKYFTVDYLDKCLSSNFEFFNKAIVKNISEENIHKLCSNNGVFYVAVILDTTGRVVSVQQFFYRNIDSIPANLLLNEIIKIKFNICNSFDSYYDKKEYFKIVNNRIRLSLIFPSKVKTFTQPCINCKKSTKDKTTVPPANRSLNKGRARRSQ